MLQSVWWLRFHLLLSRVCQLLPTYHRAWSINQCCSSLPQMYYRPQFWFLLGAKGDSFTLGHVIHKLVSFWLHGSGTHDSFKMAMRLVWSLERVSSIKPHDVQCSCAVVSLLSLPFLSHPWQVQECKSFVALSAMWRAACSSAAERVAEQVTCAVTRGWATRAYVARRWTAGSNHTWRHVLWRAHRSLAWRTHRSRLSWVVHAAWRSLGPVRIATKIQRKRPSSMNSLNVYQFIWWVLTKLAAFLCASEGWED